MELTVETIEDSITYVTLSGAMDIDGASSIDANMSRVAAAGKNVVVDMSHVDYIASFGIQTLLAAAQSVHRSGGKMVVASPQDMVERIIRGMAANELIPVFRSRSDALAAVHGQPQAANASL